MEGDYGLGKWVTVQRGNKSDLSPERIERLDAINFVWAPLSNNWNEGLRKLKQYKKREGDCNVTQSHIEGSFQLGQWVRSKRQNKATLSLEKLVQLEAIGFVWDVLLHEWEESFRKLQQFQLRESHCNVPSAHVESGIKLGNWAWYQRKNKTKLSPERVKRLEALGFVWDPRAASWEEGYENLLKFYIREGHCKVPRTHRENGYSLGGWVKQQRAKKAKLSQIQLEKLASIGFVWRAHRQKA